MDYIRIYENILTEDECKNIISIINNSDTIEGKILNSFGQNIIDKTKKNCISFDYNFELLENNIKIKIYEYLGKYINIFRYCPNHGSFKITFKKYIKNEGFHIKHVDSNTIFASKRYLAFIIYLNTINEGGETVFYLNEVINIKPIKGSMVIFPPFWMFEHEGKIPITDDKYIITGFLNYEIF